MMNIEHDEHDEQDIENTLNTYYRVRGPHSVYNKIV